MTLNFNESTSALRSGRIVRALNAFDVSERWRGSQAQWRNLVTSSIAIARGSPREVRLPLFYAGTSVKL